MKRIAGEENLEKAKRSLERFHLVGLTERFDLSLHVLGRLSPCRLNLKYRRYVIPKDDRIKNELLSDDAMIEKAREANQLDVELYEFAKREVFPECCRRAGVDPAGEAPSYHGYRHDFIWRYRLGRFLNKTYRTIQPRRYQRFGRR